jgi:hypothetical protein
MTGTELAGADLSPVTLARLTARSAVSVPCVKVLSGLEIPPDLRFSGGAEVKS